MSFGVNNLSVRLPGDARLLADDRLSPRVRRTEDVLLVRGMRSSVPARHHGVLLLVRGTTVRPRPRLRRVGTGLLAIDQLRRSTAGLWLVGLAVTLAATLCTHYYGVLVILPLALAEAVRGLSRHRVDAPVWAAFAVSGLPLVWHLPLIRAGAAYAGAFWSPPQWVNLPDFYSDLLGWQSCRQP